MDEIALTLREAAKQLNVSYSTIFAKREKIAFRLPDFRIWRVWPSVLASLSKKSHNLTRLALRVTGELSCPSENIPTLANGGLISARQAAKELDNLLALKTVKPRKNITTA